MTSVFSGGVVDWARHRKLLVALIVSVLLHLLIWTLSLPLLPSASTGSKGALAAVMLNGVVGEASPVAVQADAAAMPGDDQGSRSDQLLPADPPANPQRQSGAPAAAVLLAAVGERRLAVQVPAYLKTALDVPARDWYFSPAELTVAPLLQGEPLIEAPENPANADAAGGKVRLRVLVAADGAVDRVDLEGSDLPAAFTEVAVAAFTRLHFRPGEIDGVAVTSEARFEVLFDVRERGRSHSAGEAGGR